jgi:hypothetical protein
MTESASTKTECEGCQLCPMCPLCPSPPNRMAWPPVCLLTSPQETPRLFYVHPPVTQPLSSSLAVVWMEPQSSRKPVFSQLHGTDYLGEWRPAGRSERTLWEASTAPGTTSWEKVEPELPNLLWLTPKCPPQGWPHSCPECLSPCRSQHT